MSDRRRHSEKETGGYDESQNYGNSRQSRYEGENKNSNRYQSGAAPSRSPSPPPHHATKKHFNERRRSNSVNSKDGYARNDSNTGRNSGRGRG